MTRSNYAVARRIPDSELPPWVSVILVAGKEHDLGSFETEEEAIRAVDNVLFYLHAFGFEHPAVLGFPEEYKTDPPPMMDVTLMVIFDCFGRKGLRRAQQLPRSVFRFRRRLSGPDEHSR